MTIQALPYILLQGFLYGSTLIASRFGIEQFHPTTYAGLRMALASLCYAAFRLLDSRRRKWPTDPRLWRHAAMLGILGTAVPMIAFVGALQYQSAGLMSVLVTSGPAITVLMAHFFLTDEVLTGRKSVGVALALGGALLLAVRGESGLPDVSQANPLGYGLVLLGLLCGSTMTVYARKFMLDFDAFDVATVRMFVATLAVVPLSALLVGMDLRGVDSRGYFALGFAAVMGNFAGMLLSFYNIKRFGATAAAMPLYVIPVVGGLGGVLFLGEQITAGMTTGMALIAAGIALINRRARA